MCRQRLTARRRGLLFRALGGSAGSAGRRRRKRFRWDAAIKAAAPPLKVNIGDSTPLDTSSYAQSDGPLPI